MDNVTVCSYGRGTFKQGLDRVFERHCTLTFGAESHSLAISRTTPNIRERLRTRHGACADRSHRARNATNTHIRTHLIASSVLRASGRCAYVARACARRKMRNNAAAMRACSIVPLISGERKRDREDIDAGKSIPVQQARANGEGTSPAWHWASVRCAHLSSGIHLLNESSCAGIAGQLHMSSSRQAMTLHIPPRKLRSSCRCHSSARATNILVAPAAASSAATAAHGHAIDLRYLKGREYSESDRSVKELSLEQSRESSYYFPAHLG